MFKKLALGAGILFGVAHIGLLGHLMHRPTATQIPLPETGDYSSYRITEDLTEVTLLNTSEMILVF